MSTQFGYSDKVPVEVREILMHLCQDVVHLQATWSFYIRLFADPSDIVLLAEMASASFQIIEESLRCDITMTVSRLSDKQFFRGKTENISMATLFAKCAEVPQVAGFKEQFEAASNPIVYYRNKMIGHNDLNSVLHPSENLVPGVSRSQIEEFVQISEAIVATVYEHYDGGQLSFEPISKGDADELIFWLKKARSAPRNRRTI